MTEHVVLSETLPDNGSVAARFPALRHEWSQPESESTTPDPNGYHWSRYEMLLDVSPTDLSTVTSFKASAYVLENNLQYDWIVEMVSPTLTPTLQGGVARFNGKHRPDNYLLLSNPNSRYAKLQYEYYDYEYWLNLPAAVPTASYVNLLESPESLLEYLQARHQFELEAVKQAIAKGTLLVPSSEDGFARMSSQYNTQSFSDENLS